MSTAKTGKHGSAKANIRAQDIFTGKMKEFIGPTSHNVDTPFVVNKEYTVINIDEDTVEMIDGEGAQVVGGCKLPTDADLSRKLQKAWEDICNGSEKELIVMVTKALGEEHITQFKEK